MTIFGNSDRRARVARICFGHWLKNKLFAQLPAARLEAIKCTPPSSSSVHLRVELVSLERGVSMLDGWTDPTRNWLGNAQRAAINLNACLQLAHVFLCVHTHTDTHACDAVILRKRFQPRLPHLIPHASIFYKMGWQHYLTVLFAFCFMDYKDKEEVRHFIHTNIIMFIIYWSDDKVMHNRYSYYILSSWRFSLSLFVNKYRTAAIFM